MAFGIPSFFKTTKHRDFNYKPRYYSEEAERKAELERRVREVNGELAPSERIAFSANLRNKWDARRSSRKAEENAQRLRLSMVVIALAGLVWLFFNLS